MKTCSKCQEIKDFDEFSVRKTSPDGRRGVCKACRRIGVNRRAAKYRNTHPERVRESRQRWVEANPDRYAESQRRSAQRNREERLARARQRYHASGGAVCERKRVEKERRRRVLGIPEQGSLEHRVNLSLRNGGDGKSFLDAPYTLGQLKTWAREVKANWDHTCVMCGATENLHAHHMMPKARYPEFALDLANGVCLCEECHKLQHS